MDNNNNNENQNNSNEILDSNTLGSEAEDNALSKDTAGGEGLNISEANSDNSTQARSEQHQAGSGSKIRVINPYVIVSGSLALLAGAVLLTAKLSTPFAEWYARGIAQFFRAFLGTLTGWIPFSLAECLLLSLLPLAIFYMVRATRAINRSSSNRVFLKQLLPLVCIILNMFSVYTLAFGTSNYRNTLDTNLGISRQEISAEELYSTFNKLNTRLSELADEIDFSNTASAMPYSFYELSAKLNEAYSVYADKNDYISTFYAMPKAVALSGPMTYTHISGVYSFFTGEANVNINYPDYVIPYTMAHEMAHQRGIARENEANFVAFLVCMESDDVYIRYSALLGLQEYVLSALSRASYDLYVQAYYELDIRFRLEFRAYSEFFEKYRSSVAATVAEKVNDTFLQVQGQTQGTRSYGLVVDLAVMYFKDK